MILLPDSLSSLLVTGQYRWANWPRRAGEGQLAWNLTGGSLPAGITYARPGVAYAWQAGSPLPVLVQIAADTPRFSVCPPGVDRALTGQAMGLLFEPAGQNLLPFGRATATGWTSTNVSVNDPVEAIGVDGVTFSARLLIATANGVLHYRTTPPASQTAKWVFSAWVKRIAGMGKVWLTLKAGVEIDISAALANFYIDGSDNHQYAWARVYVAIPGTGPWYGDIATCDRIGFRIDESGDAIAVDALQLEIGDYPTSEILNDGATLNTRSADRLLIDLGGIDRKYLLDADEWAADASAAALLWRIRQERHLGRIMIAPNGGDWDIDLQTPAENRPNMGWHDGAPSPVIYSISQPEGLPIRDQVYASGYVIEAATFGAASLSTYAPTAYAIASASSQRLRWRRSSGGLSTAGGATEKKLSFCLLGQSGADSASDEVYLHTTQQNVLVRLNGSDGKFHIRFGSAGTWPVMVTSANTYNTAGLKWAIFGAWDCTAGTSSKVRVYIVTVSGGALSVETVSSTDALAHTSFVGTNLGGDAYIFLGSTNGAASYANGKLGLLWWLADWIDWSNSAFRDVLIEKSAADVLQAKDLDTAAAVNAAVNSLSPEIWLALNDNEQLGSPYNRGSLGVANVLTYVDNAPTFGAWA